MQTIAYSTQLQNIAQLNNNAGNKTEELTTHTTTILLRYLRASQRPSAEKLEGEVFLPNRDIGFVQIGMPAEIKIHTFSFTKHNVIEGEITSISDDTIAGEKKGLIYSMRVQLKPGMAATAEVQTDERRIIEFFTASLVRYSQEGLKER